MENKKVFWWNKEYTQEELMKDAKQLLVVVGALFLVSGLFLLSGIIKTINVSTGRALISCSIGAICLIGAHIPIFVVRFICVASWVLYLLYNNLFIQINIVSIIAVVIGVTFLYKMFKYKDNL
ncbi:MAG: hypothetical protein KAI70_03920 [Candidatus Omnitrophica bacterium]|nr:hypothetical protein [Candidatus Omnitrophota bacterium]